MYFCQAVRSFEQTLTPLDGVLFLLQSCEKRIRLCTFSGSHGTTVKAGLTLQVHTTVTPWEHVFRIKTQSGFVYPSRRLSGDSEAQSPLLLTGHSGITGSLLQHFGRITALFPISATEVWAAAVQPAGKL